MKEWSIFLGKCVLYLLVWGGFVAIVTNMDKDTIDDLPVWANMIIVLVVFIAPFWLSKIIWNKGEQLTNNISNQIKETVETKKVVQETQQSMQEYNEAKSRFKYLSNDVLLNKYKEYQENKLEDMIRLALEEELVERKLITHSPMHNKLDAIMTKMKL
jgi:predicted PurR-regulated permease PerM